MSKHKSEDYKISAVNYYLDNDVSMDYVCNIFNCKKQSLSRWVQRYNNDKFIKRYNRKPISYKITKQQVDYAIKLLKQNEQISMLELSKEKKNKYLLNMMLGYINLLNYLIIHICGGKIIIYSIFLILQMSC